MKRLQSGYYSRKKSDQWNICPGSTRAITLIRVSLQCEILTREKQISMCGSTTLCTVRTCTHWWNDTTSPRQFLTEVSHLLSHVLSQFMEMWPLLGMELKRLCRQSCAQKIAHIVVMAGEAYNVERLKASDSKHKTSAIGLAFTEGVITHSYSRQH